MPSAYHIDPARGLIIVSLAGPVSVYRLRQARAKVMADPAYDPRFGLLVDLSDADVTLLIGHALRQLAERPPTAGRMAIVVASDLAYGMARMYELASPADVAVFHSRAEAEVWLVQGDV